MRWPTLDSGNTIGLPTPLDEWRAHVSGDLITTNSEGNSVTCITWNRRSLPFQYLIAIAASGVSDLNPMKNYGIVDGDRHGIVGQRAPPTGTR